MAVAVKFWLTFSQGLLPASPILRCRLVCQTRDTCHPLVTQEGTVLSLTPGAVAWDHRGGRSLSGSRTSCKPHLSRLPHSSVGLTSPTAQLYFSPAWIWTGRGQGGHSSPDLQLHLINQSEGDPAAAATASQPARERTAAMRRITQQQLTSPCSTPANNFLRGMLYTAHIFYTASFCKLHSPYQPLRRCHSPPCCWGSRGCLWQHWRQGGDGSAYAGSWHSPRSPSLCRTEQGQPCSLQTTGSVLFFFFFPLQNSASLLHNDRSALLMLWVNHCTWRVLLSFVEKEASPATHYPASSISSNKAPFLAKADHGHHTDR